VSSKIVRHKNTGNVRDVKREQLYPLEVDDPDDLANLPPGQVVSGEQLKMHPGQTLAQKARELGVTQPTLRLWSVEWRGSGYDPDYRNRRASRTDWLKNKWKDKDWTEALRQQINKQQHRHVGDLLLELGVPAGSCQVWSQKHATWEQTLWHSGVPYPPQHWRDFIAWIRHGTIDRYRELKAQHIADGMDETEAMHAAADEAVTELAHKTRQRRRIERDTLLGIGGHEELLRRYRGNARLTDAHSRRIAKRVHQVSRFAVMERALREVGYDEADIERTMGELMGAFKVSKEAGQAKWKKRREAVLRRRAEADAMHKAQEIEADVLKLLPGVRASKHVKKWVEQKYADQAKT
jgi:hypothetical protein